MSKYKFMWVAKFKGKTIRQDPEDRYSKHDPKAEWNPTSFRDYVDYAEEHLGELERFELKNKNTRVWVDFCKDGKPVIYEEITNRWGNTRVSILHKEKRPLTNLRVIYYRKMECEVKNGELGEPYVRGFVIGYQGIDENGMNRKKEVVVI